ncbi:hypothetical protein AMTR_s00004p00230250 [Amborella trichopoda]|uniref:Uncharacterized protein n=1 Tax=Amborella trichopoda TaxID=13333 RepID=W1NE89_AMBTC|nr:hypothetical protein AMTR_s00004p00230250 [Amborella trichopoda]
MGKWEDGRALQAGRSGRVKKIAEGGAWLQQLMRGGENGGRAAAGCMELERERAVSCAPQRERGRAQQGRVRKVARSLVGSRLQQSGDEGGRNRVEEGQGWRRRSDSAKVEEIEVCGAAKGRGQQGERTGGWLQLRKTEVAESRGGAAIERRGGG